MVKAKKKNQKEQHMMRELRSSINVIKKKKTNELKNINISEGSQGKHCTI